MVQQFVTLDQFIEGLVSAILAENKCPVRDAKAHALHLNGTCPRPPSVDSLIPLWVKASGRWLSGNWGNDDELSRLGEKQKVSSTSFVVL